LADDGAERIVRIVAHAFQRRGGVDVPEDQRLVRLPPRDHLALEELVEDADAARFHDDVVVGGLVEDARDAVDSFARVDDDARPVGIGLEVAVLLAAVRVGLEERDAEAEVVQRADDAAVVGRGTVPVRAYETAAEEGDSHESSCHSERSEEPGRAGGGSPGFSAPPARTGPSLRSG
jgi:hypothetical protein